jgi:hypothetical protein
MTDNFYNRSSFQPIRKNITLADLEAALPRLYCSSYFNRTWHSVIDPLDRKYIEPTWNIKVNLHHKVVGFLGIGDYIEICITREYTNYTQVITSWVSLNRVFPAADIKFQKTYKNGYSEDTFKNYISAECANTNYDKLSYTYYLEVCTGLKDCLEDWVESISIVRYEPRENAS